MLLLQCVLYVYNVSHISSHITLVYYSYNKTHNKDGTTYDTVFQTTNGFALILRVYLPIDNNRAPSMTLHGVRASHNWLDIRMKVSEYIVTLVQYIDLLCEEELKCNLCCAYLMHFPLCNNININR